ncbi:nucleotidyltransferase family protein [Chryseobacterium sp. A321]
MKALLFAAGKGTRLKPFTDSHPKALAKVNGKTLLERNLLYLQSYGIKDVVINLHHFGDQIRTYLNDHKNFGANIEFSDESLALLETGGGLLFAKEMLQNEKDFLIMNADILTDLNLSSLINHHRNTEALVTLAVSNRNSSRKLLFNGQMELKGWRNTTTGEEKLSGENTGLTPLAFSGIHCLDSKFLEKMKRTGKFSIMDEYLDQMQEGIIQGFEHKAKLVDVGRPESVIEAEKHFD